jgi:hypothetical protein
MKASAWIKLLLSAMVGSLLWACGSGGYESGGMDGTGSEEPSVATGEIAAFGSVFVNGVEYDTEGAAITLDEAVSGEHALKLGMVVTVTGSVNDDGVTGKASRIEFVSQARGPIGSLTVVDADTVTMTVWGKTLQIDDDTSLHGVVVSDLVVGMVVQASGFRDEDGVLHASHLEKIGDQYSEGDALTLRVVVDAVDHAQKMFTADDVHIDYGQATLLHMRVDQLVVGAALIVQGTSQDGGSTVMANTLRPDDWFRDRDDDDDASIEVEGIISNYISLSDFRLQGYRVNASQADFERGDADDLASGVRVEVAGMLNAEGVLVADEVVFKKAAAIRLAGPIEDIDVSTKSFVVRGTRFTSDVRTRFRDESDEEVRYFGFANLRTGDYVDVLGLIGDNQNYATRVQRMDEDDDDGDNNHEEEEDDDHEAHELDVRGPITQINGAMLRVLQVYVDVSQVEDDGVLEEIEVGDVIRVRGVENDMGVIVATELRRTQRYRGHDDEGE